ncbi:hypothetical protein BKA80DRAFT_254912 [Phyllosticta citrichinensis]
MTESVLHEPKERPNDGSRVMLTDSRTRLNLLRLDRRPPPRPPLVDVALFGSRRVKVTSYLLRQTSHDYDLRRSRQPLRHRRLARDASIPCTSRTHHANSLLADRPRPASARRLTPVPLNVRAAPPPPFPTCWLRYKDVLHVVRLYKSLILELGESHD